MISTPNKLRKISLKIILSEITVPANCIEEEYLENPSKYITAIEKSGSSRNKLLRPVKVLKKEIFVQMLSKYLKVIDDISEEEIEEFCKSLFKRKNIIGLVFVEDIKEDYLETVLEAYRKIHKIMFDINLYRKRRSQISGEELGSD